MAKDVSQNSNICTGIHVSHRCYMKYLDYIQFELFVGGREVCGGRWLHAEPAFRVTDVVNENPSR